MDIKKMLTDSKDWWPADYGNYGPFLIRLAWHNAGSYRRSDGRGGVDGGRQRFDPERSWEDNTNLDKARKLLEPIKEKYGKGLSWGDLFVLAGNTAIKEMGGPILGFCGGRIDDTSGKASLLLGPTTEQEKFMTCYNNTQLCEAPLGASVVGLIYVNPTGPMGRPDRLASAKDIRDVFGRMNMDDSETVALIGGGHTFGKMHGACPLGAGKPPNEDPNNPWAGKCGSGNMIGKGVNTFTSGLECPWTTNPLKWEYEFFHNLLQFNESWVKWTGPGEKSQWKIDEKKAKSPTAPNVDGNGRQNIGMATTDLALMIDPEYAKIVKHFNESRASFDTAFKNAWYKLTSRDMGPRSRCINSDAPPSQPWQHPLPNPPPKPADYVEVEKKLTDLMQKEPETTGLFARLSFQCSSNFRSTDYLGGCNGARVRMNPQRTWEVNINLDNALKKLSSIKTDYGVKLSWADLIILAGNVAVKLRGGNGMKFCSGRTDAPDRDESYDYIHPKIGNAYEDPSWETLHDYISVSGLSFREFTALYGGGYVIGDTKDCNGIYCLRASYHQNDVDAKPIEKLSNKFFRLLFSEEWEPMEIRSVYRIKGISLYKARGKEEYMLPLDFLFRDDARLSLIAKKYASNNNLFLGDFASAWTKLSNIDRFDGPLNSVCD